MLEDRQGTGGDNNNHRAFFQSLEGGGHGEHPSHTIDIPSHSSQSDCVLTFLPSIIHTEWLHLHGEDRGLDCCHQLASSPLQPLSSLPHLSPLLSTLTLQCGHSSRHFTPTPPPLRTSIASSLAENSFPLTLASLSSLRWLLIATCCNSSYSVWRAQTYTYSNTLLWIPHRAALLTSQQPVFALLICPPSQSQSRLPLHHTRHLGRPGERQRSTPLHSPQTHSCSDSSLSVH